MNCIMQRILWKRFVTIFTGLAVIITSGATAYGIGLYTNNGDGTITDEATGLIWQQQENTTERNWEESQNHCENLNLGGSSNWRVPNIRELDSIVDLSQYNPSIDPIFTCQEGSHWSATSYASNPAYAWFVNFDDYGFPLQVASGSDHFDLKSVALYVRCVRSSAFSGTGSFVGGTTNVPVQNGQWLFLSIVAGCYLLYQRRRTIKQS